MTEAVASIPPQYPARWEADVALADGATVRVRPIRPDDRERLLRFHSRQSDQSIYYRFFSARRHLPDNEVDRLVTVDYRDRMAFIALLGDEMIGVARYDQWRDPGEAEVAFFTDDEHHGRGLATLLLEYLAVAGRENGFHTFTAVVLPENRRMINVFRQAGFQVTTGFADGLVEVKLGLEPTDEGEARIADRARRAEARSVERILNPSSVAIIGASRNQGSIGHEVFCRVLDGDFQGPAYPVNVEADHVRSVRAFRTILDVPGDVDTAIIAVPAPEVVDVVKACALKRVRGLIVLSAGFAETGPEGAALERQLVETARLNGMRLIGPNCLGVANTDPDVRMHAVLGRLAPLPGRVALSTQSGTLGLAVLDHTRAIGLGMSAFVAMGNKSDVSGNDLIQYWEEDEGTSVILLHLESFGNPRKFHRIARRVSRRKPIVAVKTEADVRSGGVWAAGATTGALLAQAGVIRVDTVEELFDVAQVLVDQPPPSGNGVAIVTNSGGAASLAAEACRGAGLQLVELGDEASGELLGQLPLGARVTTSVDLTYGATPDHYRVALDALLAHPDTNAVMVFHAPPMPDGLEEVAGVISEMADKHPDIPFVATQLGVQTPSIGRVPVFRFPERAARALGRAAAYGAWRSEPEGTLPDVDPDRLAVARELVAARLAASPGGMTLDEEDVVSLLEAVGLQPIARGLARSADEAVEIAESIGWPVVVKAKGRGRFAKSEETGLALDLHGADELRASWDRMVASLGDRMGEALVQKMGRVGFDVRVAVHQDPTYGSVVGLGRGGSSAGGGDALTVGIVPLSDLEARRLVERSPLHDALTDDAQALRIDAVEDLLARVAALADAIPELAELGLDPVLVSETAVAITDVSARIAPWVVDHGPAVRRLGA
ncbi:MAG: GNAT family N-acetyltransferase [Actinomycetota bacterium]|nr:GNAT family N-acetyltransferase [Actinomycetota bacterium]